MGHIFFRPAFGVALGLGFSRFGFGAKYFFVSFNFWGIGRLLGLNA
jgi:hypothetical protein